MPDGDDQDKQEVKPDAIPSLDQVNDLTQHQLENEGTDEVPDEAPKEEPAKEEPTPDPAPAPEATPEPTTPEPQPAPQVDTETTKPGPGKVSVKSFDGKTYYFNNLDEVPNDFEPASYAETMRAAKDFARKEDADEKAERKAEREAAKAQANDRIKDIQAGWDKDIASLTEAGTLPKETKDAQPVIDEVYEYMEKQLKTGVIVDNFTEAYKAVQYDKMLAKEAEETQALNDAKKKRGGQVQAGGTSAAPKSTVREAPPQGLSLDAIHAKVLSEL